MGFPVALHEKSWRFCRPNGETRFAAVTLSAEGNIIGCNHPNESFWAWEHERLVFKNPDGHTTSISKEPMQAQEHINEIEMVQPRDMNTVVAVLKEREAILECLPGATLEDIHHLLINHKAFSGSRKIGRKGFSLPSIENLEVIQVCAETLPRLKEIGIEATGVVGNTNIIVIDAAMPKIRLSIQFFSRARNVVVLDKDTRLRGSLNFSGDENVVVIGRGHSDNGVTATFRYHTAGLFLGDNCSSPGTNYWIEGPGKSIQVGDDMMFSWGVWVLTADAHALVDLASGNIVNPSRSVTIGPHVWLGQDVLVMPGAVVGGGSVVGARSVVTKAIPTKCVAVGAPARVVRRGASWSRLAHPSPEMISHLRNSLFDDIDANAESGVMADE